MIGAYRRLCIIALAAFFVASADAKSIPDDKIPADQVEFSHELITFYGELLHQRNEIAAQPAYERFQEKLNQYAQHPVMNWIGRLVDLKVTNNGVVILIDLRNIVCCQGRVINVAVPVTKDSHLYKDFEKLVVGENVKFDGKILIHGNEAMNSRNRNNIEVFIDFNFDRIEQIHYY